MNVFYNLKDYYSIFLSHRIRYFSSNVFIYSYLVYLLERVYIINNIKNDIFVFILKKFMLYFLSTILSLYFNLFCKLAVYIYYSGSNLFYLLNFIQKSSLFRFKSCVEFTLVDRLGKPYRHKIIYMLLSTFLSIGIYILFL